MKLILSNYIALKTFAPIFNINMNEHNDVFWEYLADLIHLKLKEPDVKVIGALTPIEKCAIKNDLTLIKVLHRNSMNGNLLNLYDMPISDLISLNDKIQSDKIDRDLRMIQQSISNYVAYYKNYEADDLFLRRLKNITTTQTYKLLTKLIKNKRRGEQENG